jgi:uncharacterized damage-inducible protein DinB
MLLQEVLALFEFDAWAADRTIESVSSVPEQRYLEDLKSSHGGIHGTLVHIYGSNMVWLHRWKGSSPFRPVTVSEIPNLQNLKNHWKECQADLNSYLGTLNESKLNSILSYSDLKGNPQSEPLFQQMQHLVNHASYHRGQIVTMLRQIGSKPIGTDLIMFYRTRPKPRSG